METFTDNAKTPATFAGFNPPFQFDSFKEFMRKLDFDNKYIEELTHTSPRTVRRWVNENTAPEWLYLLLYAAGGYILHKDWHGWRIVHGELVSDSAPSTKHFGFKATQLFDLGFTLQNSHSIAHSAQDIKAENVRLMSLLLKYEENKKIPANVIVSPWTTKKQLIRSMQL